MPKRDELLWSSSTVFKIACIEEIALNNKWIDKTKIKEAIKFYGKCEYSEYLKKLI